MIIFDQFDHVAGNGETRTASFLRTTDAPFSYYIWHPSTYRLNYGHWEYYSPRSARFDWLARSIESVACRTPGAPKAHRTVCHPSTLPFQGRGEDDQPSFLVYQGSTSVRTRGGRRDVTVRTTAFSRGFYRELWGLTCTYVEEYIGDAWRQIGRVWDSEGREGYLFPRCPYWTHFWEADAPKPCARAYMLQAALHYLRKAHPGWGGTAVNEDQLTDSFALV